MCCAVFSRSVMSYSLWPHGHACQTPLSMGILQARILEWVAMPSSRGSSQPRYWTQVSLIVGRLFTLWATREALFTTSSTNLRHLESKVSSTGLVPFLMSYFCHRFQRLSLVLVAFSSFLSFPVPCLQSIRTAFVIIFESRLLSVSLHHSYPLFPISLSLLENCSHQHRGWGSPLDQGVCVWSLLAQTCELQAPWKLQSRLLNPSNPQNTAPLGDMNLHPWLT